MTGQKRRKNQSSSTFPDKWKDFVATEIKTGSKLGKSLESSGYGGYEKFVLTLCFPDENSCKKAKSLADKIKNKLQKNYQWKCDRINFVVGAVSRTKSPTAIKQQANKQRTSNPLQALYRIEPELSVEKEEEKDQRMEIFKETVAAEQQCQPIYDKLNQRTELLAGNTDNTFKASFSWRLRVGGERGFRDLLLPVLHPVFGVPYLPASTLKGAARAWAENAGESKKEICELFGIVDGQKAQAAKVEFLDAFPTKPCLSVDIANPQWQWQNNRVVYGSEPHPLISLKEPQFYIGLRPTSEQYQTHIATVRNWLENALKSGLGSRVSSGYGRKIGQQSAPKNTSHSFGFTLWTKEMYGISKDEPEFRPTAIRGILRYWFRAAKYRTKGLKRRARWGFIRIECIHQKPHESI